MKNIALLLILSVNIFLTSCQPEGFQDLTPDDGHRDHFYFNSLKFEDALLVEPGLPDTIFEIDQPDYLVDRSIFTYDRRWYTTDTFAFDPQDFEPVMKVLTGTIMSRSPLTTYPASDLSQINLAGRIAWSKSGEFWIVRWGTAWIQIHREKTVSGWISKWRYTACAVWMEGKVKEVKGDVS